MVVVILTGHVPVRGHLYTMGLFDGDPTCRFCRKETETVQHIICCCKALARQRYSVFGNPLVEPKDISTASVRDLCLFIRGTGLFSLYWLEYLGLHNKPKAEVHPGHKLTGPKEEEGTALCSKCGAAERLSSAAHKIRKGRGARATAVPAIMYSTKC